MVVKRVVLSSCSLPSQISLIIMANYVTMLLLVVVSLVAGEAVGGPMGSSSSGYYTTPASYYTTKAPAYYTTKKAEYYTTTYAAPSYYTEPPK
ncbi:hypothetical protein OUZ56_027968 [Daphnia magna]|uniref:Uncharacterized protein n=2 Tax=Daphnia magna TaxID=35525 RepID=A0ABR0B2G1_9CRUS|nr:hypothetical protein OUZ56_027968 [Daphnia magna]